MISIIFGPKLPLFFKTQNIVQSSQNVQPSCWKWHVSLVMSSKLMLFSTNYAAVDLQNSNWSFSGSFRHITTYKVADSKQNFVTCVSFDEIWQSNSENFNGLAQLQFATLYWLLYLLPLGQGSEHKGEGRYQQTLQTQSENIHFKLKIMCIIVENRSSYGHLISGISIQANAQNFQLFLCPCSWFDRVF